MPQPHLLVHQSKQFIGLPTFVIRNANVRQAQQLQHFVFAAPDRLDLVFRPAALHFAGHLVISGNFEQPAARFEQGSEHFNRSGII